MVRRITLSTAFLLSCVSPAYSQVNESRKFSNVFHSPAAKSTASWVWSVLQMEVVVKQGDSDARIQYANGIVVSKEGLMVSVLNEPGSNTNESGGIESAAVLMLDGSGVPAELVAYKPDYGVEIFRVSGLDLRPLALSKGPLVADRRVNWHAVYKQGSRTILYSRPLRIHKAKHQMADTEDLCQMIDPGTSALNAERTGSGLVALDGTLIGIMG